MSVLCIDLDGEENLHDFKRSLLFTLIAVAMARNELTATR